MNNSRCWRSLAIISILPGGWIYSKRQICKRDEDIFIPWREWWVDTTDDCSPIIRKWNPASAQLSRIKALHSKSFRRHPRYIQRSPTRVETNKRVFNSCWFEISLASFMWQRNRGNTSWWITRAERLFN